MGHDMMTFFRHIGRPQYKGGADNVHILEGRECPVRYHGGGLHPLLSGGGVRVRSRD